MRLRTRAQALWRALTCVEQLDAAMDEEMRFHIDMEADRLRREYPDATVTIVATGH